MGVFGLMMLAWATLGTAGMASAATIDDFSITSFSGVMLVAPGDAVHHDLGVAGVAGGSREITLQAIAASGIVNSVGLDISGGAVSYGTGPSAEGALQLNYAGASLADDLAAPPASLWIDFLRFDDAGGVGMDVTIVLSDGANSASLTESAVTPSLSPFSLGFQLAMFSGIAAVDVGNLQAISIRFDGRKGQDFQIDGIRSVAIPEPRSVVLAAVAIATLAVCAVAVRGRQPRS